MLTAPEVPPRPGRRHGPATLWPVAAGPRVAEDGRGADQSCAGLGMTAAFCYPSLDFSHSRTAPAAGAPGPAGVESSARRGLTTSLSTLGPPGPVPRLPAPAPLRLSPRCAPRQGPQTQCTDSPAQLLPNVEKAAWWKTQRGRNPIAALRPSGRQNPRQIQLLLL